jgi:hypothetical protein
MSELKLSHLFLLQTWVTIAVTILLMLRPAHISNPSGSSIAPTIPDSGTLVVYGSVKIFANAGNIASIASISPFQVYKFFVFHYFGGINA